MSNISKVLVTIGIIVGFLFFFGLLTASRSSEGNRTPGIFGIILFVGLIAGIKAVWKKEKMVEDEYNYKPYKLKKTFKKKKKKKNKQKGNEFPIVKTK